MIDDEIIFFCLNHNFQAKYMIRCKIATSQWNDFTLCTKTYSVCINSIIKLFIHCFERGFSNREKKLYGSFLWMGFNCLKATEPLRRDSLLFTTQFPGVPGTHLIDFRRMKGRVDFVATQWFWTGNPWIGNRAPYPLRHYTKC